MSTAVIFWKSPQLRAIIPFSSYLFNILSRSCIRSPECSQNGIVPAPRDLQQSSGPTAWDLTRSHSTLGRALSKCLWDTDTPGAPTTSLEASPLPGHPRGGHPSASLSPNCTNPKSLPAPHRTCLPSYPYWGMEFPLHFHTHSLSLERGDCKWWIFHLLLRSKDAVPWCGCAATRELSRMQWFTARVQSSSIYKNWNTISQHAQTLIAMPPWTAFLEITQHIKSLFKSFVEGKATALVIDPRLQPWNY